MTNKRHIVFNIIAISKIYLTASCFLAIRIKTMKPSDKATKGKPLLLQGIEIYAQLRFPLLTLVPP